MVDCFNSHVVSSKIIVALMQLSETKYYFGIVRSFEKYGPCHIVKYCWILFLCD